MSSLKLSAELLSLLNDQANHELMTSNTYLAMANWFSLHSFPGSAHWMRIQSEEERTHALKLFDHITKRQGAATISSLPEIKANWEGPLEIWDAIVQLEQLTSASILNIMNKAKQGDDHTTISFLNWFIDEQVEEEDTVNEINDKVKAMGKIPGLYYHLDHELGHRKKTA
eukprot:TRINITY_DN14701_c0_g1_i1.p1 TRINITY_DN14701_c0_g1~~TRINITY_DN14701_c0_g1_i1.p1  ORF type:complete len:170 (+),score=25.32 TRINITY_DN14701_c0_g1_i1:138-647(+)